MAQGKALLGGHSKQQFLTNIDGLPPLQVHIVQRERKKKDSHNLHFHLKNLLASPLSPYCTACVLCCRAQQSLMCTDTPNSGHMVHDK